MSRKQFEKDLINRFTETHHDMYLEDFSTQYLYLTFHTYSAMVDACATIIPKHNLIDYTYKSVRISDAFVEERMLIRFKVRYFTGFDVIETLYKMGYADTCFEISERDDLPIEYIMRMGTLETWFDDFA